MKSKFILASTALLLLLCHQSAFGQSEFPWEEYRARTFGEIIKHNTDDLAKSDAAYREKIGMVFTGNPLYSQVRVAYTGTTRKISPARKAHLDDWGKTFGIKPEVVALFESEMLVLECSTEHWVPVQRQVLPHFEKELKKGDMVTLYTAFTGGRKIDGVWNWIFTINEFQAYH